MALFYRGNGIRVTDEAFDLRDPRRSYALRELCNAKIVEPPTIREYHCYEMVVEDKFGFRLAFGMDVSRQT